MRRQRQALAIATLMVVTTAQAFAQETQAAFDSAVTLLGANVANDAVTASARPDRPVVLHLFIKTPPTGLATGELRALPFASADQPPSTALAKLQAGTSPGAGDVVTVPLDKAGDVPFSLQFDFLAPAKTYSGQLFLTTGGLVHRWTLTLATTGRGVIGVDPVGTKKFVTFPPFSRRSGSFLITVFDKSGAAPYSHLRARLQPGAAGDSKSLTSNFGIGSLSFFDGDGKEVDLEQRHASNVSLGAEQTFDVRVQPLSPGEYSATLQFSADQAADDAADAKVPLVILVRHHWLLPVLVILVGSAFGWYTSKYVSGARRARLLSRRTKDLRARAEFVARRSTTSAPGWQFPGEAISLGFARVMVQLSQLARLTASAMEVIVHGDEIDQLQQDVDRRLTSIESLQTVRLQVQPVAANRPAAQTAIGHLLRAATDVLDRPSFSDADRASLVKLLDGVQAWTNVGTFVATYQAAILDRRRSGECPTQAGVTSFAAGPTQTQLNALLTALPTEQAISAQTTPADLEISDAAIARLALLWREREQRWAPALTTACTPTAALEDLFPIVDAGLWAFLEDHKQQLALEVNGGSAEKPQTYDIVEVRLNTEAAGVEERRILFHPLHMQWRIQPPSGAARTMETDALRLVQYFPSAGKVKVSSVLHWQGQQIDGPECSIDVLQNPDYRTRKFFAVESYEYLAIVGATVFAIVTAMSSQYDSTFGSLAQYLGLVIWAAGAGTGGNLFSQLGATSAPGGRADAALK